MNTTEKLIPTTCLNENNEFDFESYKEKFEYYLTKQKRLLVILNTPAHNPTGYTISDEEWDKIIDLAKEHAKDEENKIILLVDIAYIDFAGPNTRNFMTKFSGLPANIMTIVRLFRIKKLYDVWVAQRSDYLCDI